MSSDLDQQTACEIGIEGYTYLYPLVIMDVTRRQLTNVKAIEGNRGPANIFVNLRTFPDARDREVVRPNFDTLYSLAWLDLQHEPLVITVPEAGTRYYLLPMLDMWSEVFACPGTRTTGNLAHNFVIVGPGWGGTIDASLNLQRIDAPTRYVWIIGRTQCNGETADLDIVHAFQDGLKITPYSLYQKDEPALPLPGWGADPVKDDEPPLIVEAMPPAEFFAYAAQLMIDNPAHFNDYPILAQLARAGFVPGEAFDLNAASPLVKQGFEEAVPLALTRIKEKQLTLTPLKNGWTFPNETMGTWGTAYLRRATVALFGLGANLVEDAIYPVAYWDSKDKPLESTEHYTVRFEEDKLPPVNAFWSITMYDEEGYQVVNAIGRYSLGTRNNLEPDAVDKSVTLYIQKDQPAVEPQSNWLPAPQEGKFNLTMRLYYPDQTLLDGKWEPPSVVKT